jgi:GAF domain-containing protein
MASPPAASRFDLLTLAARALVDATGSSACAISRVVGDVLIMLAEHASDGRTLQLGLGFLVSDFPLTAAVLADREPRALTLADPDADEAEAALLREYGFGALLMLPLEVDGEVWGLVEIYRADARPFGDDDVAAAYAVLARTSG